MSCPRTAPFAALLVLLAVLPAARAADEPLDVSLAVTQGALRVETSRGLVECPLKHTDVTAWISGYIARVKVVQTFHNPFDEKIEAVYVFPLSHTGAVDDMTMVIGERRIVGLIKKRAEARRIYEQALRQGRTAALLEQERPNIFTQSVGNIPPGQEVRIEISYVDVLEYDSGAYEFHFPMVVGPRFIPGTPSSPKPALDPSQAGKAAGPDPDTDRVPDGSKINPPVLKPGFRNGHDISLSVNIEAGVPVRDLKVVQHKADFERSGPSAAKVSLSKEDSIPNKDFILKYAVMGEKPEIAVLAHAPVKDDGGYFMLMVQPKIDEQLEKAPPRDICFLIDVSGSMSGRPMEQVKKAMARFFQLAKNGDRMQVITFAGSTVNLFKEYQPVNDRTISQAYDFVNRMQGGGGTYMLEGIKAVLAEKPDPKRLRIVIMLTDGYIGNEAEIVAEVGKRCGDKIRFWTLGIGSSVNRYLVDGVARQGGGMGKVLTLNQDPKDTVDEIVERIHRAQIAGMKIDWGGFKVFERYPVTIPDLWPGRPVIVFAKYAKGGAGKVILSGDCEGTPVSLEIDVKLPALEPGHDVLAKIWARKKIEDLTYQMGAQEQEELVDEITSVALEYRLVSKYTSFVAVDEKDLGKAEGPANPPRRVTVPVPMPEGVSFRGVFGSQESHGERCEESEPADFAPPGQPWAGGPAPGAAPMGTPAPCPSPSPSSMPRPTGTPTPTPSPTPTPTPTPTPGPTPYPSSKREASQDLESRARAERARFSGEGSVDFWQLIARQVSDMRGSAEKALARAEESAKAGRHEEAIGLFRLAYVLDSSVNKILPRASGVGDKALRGLEKARIGLHGSWRAKCPALEKRLALVIANKDLPEAAGLAAAGAGLEIEIEPGALQDSMDLRLAAASTVAFLDLRGAGASEALSWLFDPFHLDWLLCEDGKIRVSSSRRSKAPSPWVYNIGALYRESPKDGWNSKNLPVAQMIFVEKVISGMNSASDKSGSSACVLVSPGGLLVFGTPEEHEKAFGIICGIKGWKEHKEDAAAAIGKSGALLNLDRWSWKLLSEAHKGLLDAEAAANLTEACFVLDGSKEEGLLVERAVFAMTEAAVLLRGQARGLAGRAVALLGPAPETGSAGFPAGLYRLLALKNARELALVSKDGFGVIEAALRSEAVKDLKGRRLACAAILLDMEGALAESPESLITGIAEMPGEDEMVLTALAARKAGAAYVEELRKIICGKDAPVRFRGSVAVLLHRLVRGG